MTAPPAIEFLNVSAGYPGNPVLHDLSFSVAPGEIAAVIGPNGAGKTTLLRCITGLCVPRQGEVRLLGDPVSTIPAAQRARRVAVVPQEMETAVPFTVEDIVMIGRTASLSRWTAPARPDHAAVERAMVYTDVAGMKHRLFSELSGGEKQRVTVAMALAQEPRIILMDEATSHLDMNHRLEVMQIVERMNREQGMTVLMISHDLNLAAEFCHRLFLLGEGRHVASGTPSDVLREDVLRPVYHCDVRVQQDAAGTITVTPAPRLSPGQSGKGVRVHVIGGGGCAAEILRRLSLCDYTATCGGLNEGDTDHEVAAALGIETALERPFLPVGKAALEAARRLVEAADVVIVSGVPFGTGNLANLQLATTARALGKPVLIMAGIETRDYTPGRQAEQAIGTLLAGGAPAAQNIAELFARLATIRPRAGKPS